ncbi:YqhA family protein [Acetobacteraceae bacterium H6797]|nr:YqhA family protein [Acetobacteraceae bacterium H6797]
MRSFINHALLVSRYSLAVFYGGLMLALAIYAARFAWKVVVFAQEIFTMSENDALLGILYLLDSALVASLVVMVALSSYDTLVSRLPRGKDGEDVDWMDTIDPSNVKIKLATSIVAISSIHLLQMFMKVESYEDRTIIWALAIHASFLVGVLILAIMDRLEGHVAEAGKEVDEAAKL